MPHLHVWVLIRPFPLSISMSSFELGHEVAEDGLELVNSSDALSLPRAGFLACATLPGL